jgi:hypothetical protein
VKFEIGAMTVGDILDRAVVMLRARLGTFLAIHFIVLWPALVFELFVPGMMNELLVSMVGRSNNVTAAIQFLGFTLVFMVVWALLSCFSTAATLLVIAEEFTGHRVGTWAALRFAAGKFGPLLVTQLLYFLIMGVAWLPCFAPYIIFWTWFQFSSQAVVVEGVWGFRALARSRELTRGYRLRVLGLGLLLIGALMPIFALESSLQFIVPPTKLIQTERGPIPIYDTTNFNIINCISFVFRAIFQTYTDICWTLYYFDLRIRKEGYDLEVACRKQALEASRRSALP